MIELKLRRARILRNLTQKEVGELSHLEPSTISHFETGARFPSIHNLVKLAKALDVSTDFLLGLSRDHTNGAYLDISQLSHTNIKLAQQMVRTMLECEGKA